MERVLYNMKMARLLRYFLSIEESAAIIEMLNETEYSSSDIKEYLDWCKKRRKENLCTDLDSWLEDRKPRVEIEFFVTENGCPVYGKLEFPKRGEDMDHGTEFEWYYSLREETDRIMALKVGESMNFKIRDEQGSHGVILRTK